LCLAAPLGFQIRIRTEGEEEFNPIRESVVRSQRDWQVAATTRGLECR
jgi:hypothetical protein